MANRGSAAAGGGGRGGGRGGKHHDRSRSTSRQGRAVPTEDDITAGLKGAEATFFEGTIRFKYSFDTLRPLIYVYIPSLGTEALLDYGTFADTKLIHGDIVVVELNPREFWSVREGFHEVENSSDSGWFRVTKVAGFKDHELKAHIRASHADVEIDESYRSNDFRQDFLCHAQRGLQRCLLLDGSACQGAFIQRPIRVKAVDQALVGAFKAVSRHHSSSLCYEHIPGATPHEVLLNVQSAESAIKGLRDSSGSSDDVPAPSTIKSASIEANVERPRKQEEVFRVRVTGLPSDLSADQLEAQIRQLMELERLAGFHSANRLPNPPLPYRYLHFHRQVDAEAFRQHNVRDFQRHNFPGNHPFKIHSRPIDAIEVEVTVDMCPKGVLYFDKVSSASDFKDAMKRAAFTFPGEPNPVQLEFNTDTVAKSRSPSPARTVALEDNCLQPVCTFVKIVERAVAAQGRVIIGRVTLEHPKDPNSDFILKPSEESLHYHQFRLLPVAGQDLQTLSRTTLVACEYSGWPDIEEYPSATFKFVIGDIATNGLQLIDVTEKAILGFCGVSLAAHRDGQVVPADFPAAVQREIRDKGFDDPGFMGRHEQSESASQRRDLRDELVMTIDPTTSRDFDDALHVKQLDDGRFEVGIHIADVSYFVTPDSELDKEAQRRCTTTYMHGFCVPMLPHCLSETLCSLNPGVDRFAFSVIVLMNPDGSFDDKDTWFGRTIINSRCRMDYQTAQQIMDGKVTAHTWPAIWPVCKRGGYRDYSTQEVIESIRHFQGLAESLQKLGKKTEFGGNGDHIEFTKDDPAGPPTGLDIRSTDRLFSQTLIELFMVLANSAVARKTSSKKPVSDKNNPVSVLRQHGRRETAKYEQMAKFCTDNDLDGPVVEWETPPANPDGGGGGAVAMKKPGTYTAESIAAWRRKLTAAGVTPLVQEAIWKSKAKYPPRAIYCTTGVYPDNFDFTHTDLGEPRYMHFTSPIRRYPDILAHRALQAVLDPKSKALTGVVPDIHSNSDALHDLLSKWSRALMRCNENHAKDITREQNDVFMHIVAKHLLEQSDPIRVTCVVTDFIPGHVGRDGTPDKPAQILVYVSGPMFCQMSIKASDFIGGTPEQPVDMALVPATPGQKARMKLTYPGGREDFIDMLQELNAVIVPSRDPDNHWPSCSAQIPEFAPVVAPACFLPPDDWDRTPS